MAKKSTRKERRTNIDDSFFFYPIEETKITKSGFVSEFGVTACKSFFDHAGWTFQDTSKIRDVGIDAFVEWTEPGTEGSKIPTGKMFGIQIKSGKKYYKETQKKGHYFYWDSEEKHKKNWNYWGRHQLPIFVFFHYEDTKSYCFVSIREWAKSKSKWRGSEPLPIYSYEIYSMDNLLGDMNIVLTKIKNEVTNTQQEIEDTVQRKNRSLLGLYEECFKKGANYEAFLILRSQPSTRFTPLLANVLPYLILQPDIDLTRLAVHYLGLWCCSDIWFPPERNANLEYAVLMLNALSEKHWVKILSLVTNHDFSMPSDWYEGGINYGWDLRWIFIHTKNFEEVFLPIAKNRVYPEEIRINALAIFFEGLNLQYYFYDKTPKKVKGSPDQPQFKDIFLEKNRRAFLIQNDLLSLVSSYFNVSFPEANNTRIDEFI